MTCRTERSSGVPPTVLHQRRYQTELTDWVCCSSKSAESDDLDLLVSVSLVRAYWRMLPISSLASLPQTLSDITESGNVLKESIEHTVGMTSCHSWKHTFRGRRNSLLRLVNLLSEKQRQRT